MKVNLQLDARTLAWDFAMRVVIVTVEVLVLGSVQDVLLLVEKLA